MLSFLMKDKQYHINCCSLAIKAQLKIKRKSRLDVSYATTDFSARSVGSDLKLLACAPVYNYNFAIKIFRILPTRSMPCFSCFQEKQSISISIMSADINLTLSSR